MVKGRVSSPKTRLFPEATPCFFDGVKSDEKDFSVSLGEEKKQIRDAKKERFTVEGESSIRDWLKEVSIS